MTAHPVPDRRGAAISATTIESTLGPIRQTYAGTKDFPPITRAYTDVSRLVKERGLLERTRGFYALVGAAILVGFAACITGFFLLGDSWFQLFIAAALGILFTQVAFLSHEGAHRQILASGRANDRLSRLLGNGVVGMSYSWWDTKHSRHHANPNRVGKDPDIEIDTISFLDEDAASARGIRRLITKRQGWLFFPLLMFEGLNLHFLAFRHVFGRQPVKDRWFEITLLLVRHAVVYTPLFIFLPVGMALAFMGVQLAVFGVYMGASFAPNHKGMPVIDKDAKLDFFTKQVRTSRNIRGGWWATWLMGGLNYQIEHHLFPNMPRPHLAQARKIVIEACKTLDVPYTETSLLRSYAIVIDYLNRVGLAARDPFDCPMASTYRRV
ncbi:MULTISPECIES: acyl-CoA desaturase [unclassified Microbacterium]|uniref:fatty acid desaturase family protein n=1 Tax=unclassified Microbacterium TaxID=2609290 RepID=UPI00214ABDE8|nr:MULTISPECIES: acyl-CoA desaturase [unclassified Microbacterium]MCR2783582.1 acyl-CoA desaturase [Microbacterium sp. zg.B96]WIM15558.1 acyl-CoA desaturase [Microbacterium sp. zg-B96]